MLKRLARGAFLAMLAVILTAWVVTMAKSSASEPSYDPDMQWLA